MTISVRRYLNFSAREVAKYDRAVRRERNRVIEAERRREATEAVRVDVGYARRGYDAVGSGYDMSHDY